MSGVTRAPSFRFGPIRRRPPHAMINASLKQLS